MGIRYLGGLTLHAKRVQGSDHPSGYQYTVVGIYRQRKGEYPGIANRLYFASELQSEPGWITRLWDAERAGALTEMLLDWCRDHGFTCEMEVGPCPGSP